MISIPTKVLWSLNVKTGYLTLQLDNKVYEECRAIWWGQFTVVFFEQFLCVLYIVGCGPAHVYGCYNVETHECLFHTKDLCMKSINTLFKCIDENKSDFNDYLNCHSDSLTVALIFNRAHFGHVLTDELLPLLKTLKSCDSIKYVYYSADTSFYFNFSDLCRNFYKKQTYQHVDSRRTPVEYTEEWVNFFKKVCKEKIVFFKPYERMTPVCLPSDVKEYILKTQCQNKDFELICNGKKVILLVAKIDYRLPVNQTQLFNSIIKHFNKMFNNDVVFLLQGYTQITTLPDHIRKTFKEIDDIYDNLKKDNEGTLIFNLNFKPSLEVISFIKNVDLYISPAGSLQHFIHMFTKQAGVVFTPPHMGGFAEKAYPKENIYWYYIEKHCTLVECTEDTHKKFNKSVYSYNQNYNVNIKHFLEVIDKITF